MKRRLKSRLLILALIGALLILLGALSGHGTPNLPG